MSEDDIRELLGAMRDEPLPADSLARVRMAVAERTRPGRRQWKIGAAILATGSVALIFLLSPGPGPAVPAAKQATPVVAARQEDPPRPKPKVKLRRADAVRIRIETPDPDVVILLVSNGTGS